MTTTDMLDYYEEKERRQSVLEDAEKALWSNMSHETRAVYESALEDYRAWVAGFWGNFE